MRLLNRLARSRDADRGATMVEYGFMVGLIAAVAAGAVGLLGGGVQAIFSTPALLTAL